MPSSKNNKGILPRRRKSENLPGGLYYFEDELNGRGVLTAKLVTGAGWLLELLELKSGEVWFETGTQHVRTNAATIGIFYPSFTIARPCFKNTKGFLKGVAGTAELPAEFCRRPFVFETDFFASPRDVKQVTKIFASGRNVQCIEAYPQASPLSRRAKQMLDADYQFCPSIAQLAGRLKVSHEHLTRRFKADYEMTPNAYLHRLRVADATFRLACGEKIITVSNDVGYNDLSRFYKQFRKLTSASPGACRNEIKSK